jgi:CRISPR-associated endonuclease Csn1
MLRLGLDIGTNSIGWALLTLDDHGASNGVKAAGVRIFSDGRDPKSGASLAEDRRIARSMRRRRDRYLRRRDVFLQELIKAGLMPTEAPARKALEQLDPYELRAKALSEALPLHQLGRALFHINQRRGFQSNRKADRKSKDAEAGKVSAGIIRLIKAMEEANVPTLGAFLHWRRQQPQSDGRTLWVRTRLHDAVDEEAKGSSYDFYPRRQMLKDEFEQIWQKQQLFHTEALNDTLRQRLYEIMFWQRPLKAPKIGRCTFFEEERLPKTHPLFQQRRLYEEVNALKIVRTGGTARDLTLEERDKLILKLKSSKAVSFASLAKLIKLDETERFNKESDNRKDLKGDEIFAELSHKSRFGKQWAHFDADTQWHIIERLLEEENPDALHAWLTTQFKLDDAAAQAVANARLPEGHGRIGLTATRKILEVLQADVITYDKAVESAALGHHSDFRTGEVLDNLPYYGEILERHITPGTNNPDDPDDVRFGRITNPTVHIGIGQLRRITNQIIRVYGKPAQIVVELARDLKLSEKQKNEINKKNRENTEAARKRSAKLAELNQADTGANRALLKLWEELNLNNPLDRRCPYCGEQISVEQLFSDATDIDHILPYSKTLDDSPANKVIAHAHCNRAKRNRAPYDAFGYTERWPKIAELANRLPKNKRWRFAPDAMAVFEAQGGFLARQLKETQYLSKMARSYLSALYPDKGEDSSHVWVIPGQMTELLRRQWGLNSLLPDHNFVDNINQEKNRLDHRHHAIDAAVVGATDVSLLQKIARRAAQREEQALGNIAGDIPLPWSRFRDDLEVHLNAMIISHKPDHGTIAFERRKVGKDQTTGCLHNDTAYGLTKDAQGNPKVVHRVPLTSLKKIEDIESVRDLVLREALRKATFGKTGKDMEAALRNFAANPPIPCFKGLRRVRILETLNVIPIRDQAGKVYKGYKGDANHCYEVWRMPDGNWRAKVITMFDAHRATSKTDDPRPHPAAKRLFRLFKDDLIAGQFPRSTARIFRVVKFAASGALVLAPHNEAGSLKARDANKDDPFNYINTSGKGLRQALARQIRIDELGRIWDPGPREHP